MLDTVIYAYSEVYGKVFFVAIVAALLIVAVGSLYRNQIANVAAAIILGFVAVTVPATLSNELWLNNTLWFVAAGLIYSLLERLRSGPELDFSRLTVGVNRRRSARATVRSEVRKAKLDGFRFEVER